MKRMMIAGLAAGAAMMIGGALGAVSQSAMSGQALSNLAHPILDPNAEVMNPMVAGQAMLPDRTLLENISVSPEHTMLTAAMKQSGISDALKAEGQFTVFAPTNDALAGLPMQNKAVLARDMGYLVVPGKYDSQMLLKAIGEGGGQAKLRTVEGGVLLARMNGPTNITLMDERGNTADIAIYDVYDKNGVLHVIDHMLQPGSLPRQVAFR